MTLSATAMGCRLVSSIPLKAYTTLKFNETDETDMHYNATAA